MFDQIKPQNQNDKPVEDIFSTDQPETPDQAPTTPQQPTPTPAPAPAPAITPTHPPTTPQPAGPAQPLQNLKDINVPMSTKKKRSFWPIIIIIVLVGVVAVLAYFAYQKFFNTETENMNVAKPNANLEQEVVNKNTNTQPVIPEIPTSVNENINQNINIALDTDHDGLTDNEEEELGTNPNEVDTDGDNLFDYEEVKTWLTDPLNPDSDADGFLDGEETLNGFDPLGPGKLEIY